MIGGYVVSCVVSAYFLFRIGVRVYWDWDRVVMRELLAAAPTFLFISIFATLYWRIDVFMLSALRSVEDVGYYGAAWRLLELAMIVPQSFCLALYPQMASAGGEPHTLAWLGRTAVRYLLAASLPLAVGATMFGGWIMTLLYGEAFRVAADTL